MRATPITRAPAADSAVAMARPNPRLAPVTIAVVPTRPSAWVVMGWFMFVLTSWVNSGMAGRPPIQIRPRPRNSSVPSRRGPMNLAGPPSLYWNSVRSAPRDRRATVPAQEDFIEQAAPFRAELIAHCYRMLGSVHDAEDLVQETYLRGWRGYQAFEERAALRTWLYRIATTACLRALENRARRVLPAGLGDSSADPKQQSRRWPRRSSVASADPRRPHPGLARRGRRRQAQRAAGRDDRAAGTTGAPASGPDSARRRAVQRRRSRRTSRNHARRDQQRPAAGPGPPRRGRTHRRRRRRAR